ncbi:UNVERIFIED_CONTAM: hypothetical protein Sradi_7265400 [Sesamum radiatum]|uniref:Reverse transcriptase domain-containing protein n=1 Tax=Sesamum radiatum TaxID=300843 RepID=A0AAW2IJK3_SESRA
MSRSGLISLCFADDVLVFCSGSPQSALQAGRQNILDILGFPEGSLPLKYLGVPLVSSRLKIADCQGLIGKLEGRLAGWGHLNFSFAGRVQLIKSTILVERLFGRGYAKVAWRDVCAPKSVGGLGIRRILHVNQALMLKHVWRILQDDTQSIWVQWVKVHRLRNQTLWVCQSRAASWCWRKLLKLCTLLLPGLEFRVGDGRKFRLWTDHWHPRGPLILSFPRGPGITGLPTDAFLASVIRHGQWCWPSESDFDIQEIVSGLPCLYSQQSDSIVWKLPPRLSTLDRPWVSRQDGGLVWVGSRTFCGLVGNGEADFIHEASRAMLAALVYSIWRERNNRLFLDTANSADAVAMMAIEDIRCCIVSVELKPSIQLFALYRNWKIPWEC